MPDNFTPEQIAQILEEFFNTVGTRQYIGARYVPIFGRRGETSIEWDNTGTYEPLSVVLYQGNSYTSRQFVPVGVEITNQEFWAQTGNYNAQVEQYRRDALAAQEAAEAAQTDIETLLPKAEFSSINTVKDYIDASIQNISDYVDDALEELSESIVDPDTFFVNIHTASNGGTGYSIEASKDGINFSPIEGYRYSGSKVNADVQPFRYVDDYNDGWLIAQTLTSNDYDFSFGFTSDFRNMAVDAVNLGLTAYRNAHYPAVTNKTSHWVPGFYRDLNDNLFAYVAERYNNENSFAYGQTQTGSSVGYFKIFAVQVELSSTRELSAIGEVFEISFYLGGVELVNAYDVQFFQHNGMMYAVGKNGYYRHVFVARSSDGVEYDVLADNIFHMYFTEAPHAVKVPNGFLIYGQHYQGTSHVNLCVFTEDFTTFVPVDLPRSSYRMDTTNVYFMRNMNPFTLTSEEFKKLFGNSFVAVKSKRPAYNDTYNDSVSQHVFTESADFGYYYSVLDGGQITVFNNHKFTLVPYYFNTAWGHNVIFKNTLTNDTAVKKLPINAQIYAYSYRNGSIKNANIAIPYTSDALIMLPCQSSTRTDITALFGEVYQSNISAGTTQYAFTYTDENETNTMTGNVFFIANKIAFIRFYFANAITAGTTFRVPQELFTFRPVLGIQYALAASSDSSDGVGIVQINRSDPNFALKAITNVTTNMRFEAVVPVGYYIAESE